MKQNNTPGTVNRVLFALDPFFSSTAKTGHSSSEKHGGAGILFSRTFVLCL